MSLVFRATGRERSALSLVRALYRNKGTQESMNCKSKKVKVDGNDFAATSYSLIFSTFNNKLLIRLVEVAILAFAVA